MKILFYPLPVQSCNKMFYYRQYLKFETTNDINDTYDLAFLWDDSGQYLFNEVPVGCRVINGNLHNVGKDYIDRVHLSVFGYGAKADGGLCVEKSLFNGTKDCRVVKQERGREGYFYQKLLSNFGEVEEFRVFYFGGEIPCVAVKYKLVTRENICGVTQRIGWVETDSVLNTVQCEQIRAFCHAMPVDYCELDILFYEGRMYIIDVNNTPGDAALVRLRIKERGYIVEILSESFKRAFL